MPTAGWGLDSPVDTEKSVVRRLYLRHRALALRTTIDRGERRRRSSFEARLYKDVAMQVSCNTVLQEFYQVSMQESKRMSV